MKNLGKKIVVVGVSASGKSTLARRLSDKLNIPVTYMDAIMWKSGWEYIGDEETTKKLEEVSNEPQWIIEGYITKDSRTTLFEKADTIIYLDYSPVVASWRYLKRWWKHRRNPRPELPGSPEKFDFKFLKLVWSKGEAVSLNKFLAEVSNQSKIITLHSPNQTKKFVDRLGKLNHSYKNRKYSISGYDLNWPNQFEVYASQLQKIFGNDTQIEHIGSTAVPGMAGKSCIDVLVIVDNLKRAEEHIGDMEQAGFEYAGQIVMNNSRLFRVTKDNELLANIHFFPQGHPHNEEMLKVRDYLRVNSEEVEAYSKVKKELYTKYTDDYGSYRKYKDEYMERLNKRALE